MTYPTYTLLSTCFKKKCLQSWSITTKQSLEKMFLSFRSPRNSPPPPPSQDEAKYTMTMFKGKPRQFLNSTGQPIRIKWSPGYVRY